ncbi:uncharacterized protein LOC143899820 isoform X2 [Temnothorax americanus]|uniref:uncharacterized protein LOC143899820 isoform X2 n=1 Tax=Temnothorax americanus TaxID=1964332 RepID=UPI004068CF6F
METSREMARGARRESEWEKGRSRALAAHARAPFIVHGGRESRSSRSRGGWWVRSYFVYIRAAGDSDSGVPRPISPSPSPTRRGSSSAFVRSVRQSTSKTKLKMPLGNHAALTPLEDMSAGRGQAGGGPPRHCQKVFIQRDYSEGTMVKFQTRFPTELENRLDRQLFEYTINQLNNYFVEAERASCSTYCESCLYCLTGYLISICTETHYEKCLRKVAKFVSEQNDRVYKPRGLLLTDPTTRGLRLIEISVLDRPAS